MPRACHQERPSHLLYVVMSENGCVRLIERRGLWELLDRPARGTRTKKDIDAQLRSEREAWGAPQWLCLS